jgi:hypothetical protein
MRKLNLVLFILLMIGGLYSCQKTSEKKLSNGVDENPSSAAQVNTAVDDCGQLRTQTQGGWGAAPHGNNPGVYLHANFAAAFPGGLTVGCTAGHWVKYTSADAITEFLPAGGTPGVLTMNATDPANKSIKNVLIGQVTALALSVGFDGFDPSFGSSDVLLGDMVIGSGPFAGKSVSEFLAIANDVLGGCSNAFSPGDVNGTADKINSNFDDGSGDGGFLICPGPRGPNR